MAVLIYRNSKNGDMKRFSKFTKQIKAEMDVIGKVVDITYNPRRGPFYSQISDYNTVLIITHGSADKLYHKFDQNNRGNEEILFNFENKEHLKGKKIIAIACGTARELGPQLTEETQTCNVYLGFKNRIHFNIKGMHKPPGREYRQFITVCYKSILQKVLTLAIKNSWSFSKLHKVLKIELNRGIMQELKSLKLKRGEYYYKKHKFRWSAIAVSNVASNIVVLGNPNELVD